MRKSIKTSNGIYYYKEKIVFEGIKIIDKAIAKENLLLFNKIANEEGFKFALGFATFLGAMREHDFIDYDEDTDLVSLEDEKEKFFSMLFKLREQGFEVIRYDRRGDLCSIMRKNEYIDILFFHEFTNHTQIAQFYIWPEEFVNNWSHYGFQGDSFYGPSDWEKYLLFWYGENWCVPIQRDNYDLPQWKRKIIILSRIIYNVMPKFIFDRIMKKRKQIRIDEYNDRVRKYNKLIGRRIFDEINLTNNLY